MSYVPRRVPATQSLHARGLTFHIYRWPGSRAASAPPATPVVLVHGWGDTAETWQFLVDQASDQRSFIAMDLRGFGRTQRPDDGYWFPDYLADLDALLDVLSPAAPVDLVGHSMGGNVAMLYAGVRPARVRKLINLEGFGMGRTSPEEAPARYAEWLDEVRDGSEFALYDESSQLIRVLARRNPRTPPDRLEFIAQAWSRTREDGRIELWADPKHKRVNPVLYQRDQAEACWRAIVAPVLCVSGGKSEFAARMAPEISAEKLRALLREVTPAVLEDAGHMLHHEQPKALAELIEAFLR